MKNKLAIILWIFAVFLLGLANFAQAQNDQSTNADTPNGDVSLPRIRILTQTIQIPNTQPPIILSDEAQTRFAFTPEQIVNVANIEELYAAVNNSANAGNQIVLAPGVYMLSVNGSGGAVRPNGGRLELQENMSLRGTVGDRGAVVIDAIALPTASYSTPIANTGAIRIGRGINSVEWLTVSGTWYLQRS